MLVELNALGERSVAPCVRLEANPETLLDASWPLVARPGWPKIGCGANFGRPRTVQSAVRHVPETVLSAQNRTKSIIVDWSSISIDFSSVFLFDVCSIFARSGDEAECEASLERSVLRSANNPHLVHTYVLTYVRACVLACVRACVRAITAAAAAAESRPWHLWWSTRP